MSITEIEAAIVKLPPGDIDKLVLWIQDHYERLWDAQITDDLDSSKLDGMLDLVDSEIDAGMAKPL